VGWWGGGGGGGGCVDREGKAGKEDFMFPLLPLHALSFPRLFFRRRQCWNTILSSMQSYEPFLCLPP